jgi:hypothetical protein
MAANGDDEEDIEKQFDNDADHADHGDLSTSPPAAAASARLKVNFDVYRSTGSEAAGFIQRIIDIETEILEIYRETTRVQKLPHYRVYDMISSGEAISISKHCLSTHGASSDDAQFFLKIIGVWESQNEFGLAVKLIHC